MVKMCGLCGYPMGNSSNTWMVIKKGENKKELVHVRCQNVFRKGYEEAVGVL